MKIKHLLLAFVCFFTLTTTVFAQDNFTEGSNLVNFGVGFGNLYYRGFGAGYDYNSIPALTLSLDHAFRKVDAIEGTIGLGGIVGYTSSSLKYTNIYGFYRYHYNNFIIAARGTYHAGFLETQKFDLYGGLMIGLRIETVNYTTNYGAADLGNYGGAYPSAGLFVGGAYYFVSTLAVFAELGYDVSYFKIGLTLKP